MPGTKVPKNTARKQMIKEERCKTVYISKHDDPGVVREIMKSAFVGLETYTVLDCDRRCNLSVSAIKNISGEQAIERRRTLYICEVSKPMHALHAYLSAISMH